MNGSATTDSAWPRCSLYLSVPAFTAIVLALSFMRLPGHTLLWRELQNTGHTLLFGILTLLAWCSYGAIMPAARRRPLRGYLAAGVACLLTGIAVEFLQLSSGGDAEALDVMRDLAGILIALGICALLDPRLPRTGYAIRGSASRTGLLALTASLCIASSYPLASLVLAYHEREQAFPVIIDLTAHWARAFLKHRQATLARVSDPSICMAPSSDRLVSVQLEPAHYTGISMLEPRPDWTGYEHLVVEIFSARPDPLELTLRIHDGRHDQSYADRFSRVLRITQGQNRVRVPLAQVRNAPAHRQMDMSDIAGVMLFAVDPKRPVKFCMGVLRLE